MIVKHATIDSDSRPDFLDRLESVIELFLKSDYKIIAVMPHTGQGSWCATVFYSVEE